MRDYMPREREEQYGGEPMFSLDMQFFKNVLGIILIIAGGMFAFWICMTIYSIFDEPQKIEIFNQIIPPGPEVREVRIEGKEFVLPSGMFKFMAYFIGVLLLAVAARIAIGLISSGVRLLQPAIQKLEMKIASHFQKMETNIATGMDKLESNMAEGVGRLQGKIEELLERHE
jgi:hypothetical protein